MKLCYLGTQAISRTNFGLLLLTCGWGIRIWVYHLRRMDFCEFVDFCDLLVFVLFSWWQLWFSRFLEKDPGEPDDLDEAGCAHIRIAPHVSAIWGLSFCASIYIRIALHGSSLWGLSSCFANYIRFAPHVGSLWGFSFCVSSYQNTASGGSQSCGLSIALWLWGGMPIIFT